MVTQNRALAFITQFGPAVAVLAAVLYGGMYLGDINSRLKVVEQYVATSIGKPPTSEPILSCDAIRKQIQAVLISRDWPAVPPLLNTMKELGCHMGPAKSD